MMCISGYKSILVSGPKSQGMTRPPPLFAPGGLFHIVNHMVDSALESGFFFLLEVFKRVGFLIPNNR